MLKRETSLKATKRLRQGSRKVHFYMRLPWMFPVVHEVRIRHRCNWFEAAKRVVRSLGYRKGFNSRVSLHDHSRLRSNTKVCG
jgi:hypothetical protein